MFSLLFLENRYYLCSVENLGNKYSLKSYLLTIKRQMYYEKVNVNFRSRSVVHS